MHEVLVIEVGEAPTTKRPKKWPDLQGNLRGLLIGNKGQITQVLVNLLLNAVQAIKEQGQIHIARQADSTRVTLRVRDTGSGIRPEDMVHLFDPFFTTKEVGQGSGLGLSVSHGIIEQHGGSIMASSELGRWTEFKIVLPHAGQAQISIRGN